MWMFDFFNIVSLFIGVLPPFLIAMVFLLVLIVLIILGLPVSLSILLTSVLFIVAYGRDLTIVISAFDIPLQSFPLLGVFLYTLMGAIFELSGLTHVIVEALQPIVGRLKGGLAIVTAIGCALFGLLTGAVAATAAAFSRLMGPEMEKRNYPREFTAAVLTSSAPLGAFIPPSIPAIIIATATGLSTFTMFMVGASMGIVILLGLIMLILLLSYKNDYGGIERVYTRREIARNIAKALPIMAVPILVLLSIYLGVFSVTEAGALGVLLAFIVATAYRTMTPRLALRTIVEAGKTTAIVVFMIGSSYVLSHTWSLLGINYQMTNFFSSVARVHGPFISLTILAVILAVLGMFFDVIVLSIAWGPIAVSALEPMGVNPYHICALFLMGVLLGTATPPVGAAVFVVSDSLKIRIEEIFKGIRLFVLLYLALYILFIYAPQAALWLPMLLRLI